MSKVPHDELLSAYYDGEATPEERAEIQRWLATSPEARRELERFGTLSEMLRELPRPAAPRTLPQTVLKRAEREMLLPAVAAADPHRPAVHPWAVAVGSLVTTAAALVVMGLALMRGDPDAGERVAVDDREKSGRSGRVAGAGLKGSPGDRGSGARSALPRPPIAEGGPVAAPRVAKKDRGTGVPSRKGRLLVQPDAHPIRIGDVIPYLAVSGENTAVLEVTVVDVREAVGRMQLLLQKNSVPHGEQPADLKEGGDAGDGLFAVYVELTPEQLAAAWNEFEQQEYLLDLRLGPPRSPTGIPLAAAERRPSISTLADAIRSGRVLVASTGGYTVPPTGAPRSPGSGPSIASRKAKASPRPAETKDKTKTGKQPSGPGSFQLLVNVPPATLKSDEKSGSPVAAPEQSPDRKRTGRTSPPAAPVKVLVVFHEQPPEE